MVLNGHWNADNRAPCGRSVPWGLYPLDEHGDTLAYTYTHGAQGVAAAGALQLQGGGHQQAGAGHAQRVAQGDGAAVGVDPGVVVLDAQLTHDREALCGEGFVQFDDVDLVDGQALLVQQLAYCRYRADAHDARLDAGGGHAEDPGDRLEAVFLHCVGTGDQHGGGAVVDAGGVAGGNAAVFTEGCGQCGQFLQGRGAGVLVLVEDQRLLLATGDLDGDDLFIKDAVGLGFGGLFLGAQGEQILVFTGDVELLGNVLGGLRHGVDAVLLLHQRVDEAPADGGVLDLLPAGEGAVGLAHDVGCAGHGLDRKSTRLNSSHVRISYAVFCLKKKKNKYKINNNNRKKKNIVDTSKLS